MNKARVVSYYIMASQREIIKCSHPLYIMLFSEEEEEKKAIKREITKIEDHHRDF
jgi:hypothetical protein